MKYTIVWSRFASLQLDEIYKFYLENVSEHFAKKIIRDLINEVDVLSFNPYTGQREYLLEGSSKEYRYLVCKNYKIIYSVGSDQKLIKVSDVFDTRQNPEKMDRNNF